MTYSLASIIARHTGQIPKLCYHCHKCTAGCPVVSEMTYGPDQLLRMVALDLKDEVLTSRDIWLCAGCGQCTQVCIYSALTLHPVRKVMTVNPVLCQGCGACAAAYPSGAINVHHFTFEQFLAQIDALIDEQPLTFAAQEVTAALS